MIQIDSYRSELAGRDAPGVLDWAATKFCGQVTFASSLGAEDQVITHMIAESGAEIPIFTLDTGRLFQETYDTIERTRQRYGIDIQVFFPNAGSVESMVGAHGPNLFYDSVENRKLCCSVRKVEPLSRALSGKTAWITGLRRQQSITRQEVHAVDWDEPNEMVKISPLFDWSHEDTWEFIHDNDVPYHPLHDRGFPSIGCMPCTRAVQPGENARSGRWWWEHPVHKECGLHPHDEGTTNAGPRFGIKKLG